jgi:hypothetical protein
MPWTSARPTAADRPAGLVRAYRVDPATGALHEAGEVPVPQPACVVLASLSSAAPEPGAQR